MKRLSRPDFYRLCEWCRNKQELLIADAPAMTDISMMASKELGVGIAAKTISECLEITGVKYNPRVITNGTIGSKNSKRIEALEEQVRGLKADVAILRGVIRDAIGPLPGDPVKSQTVAVASNGKR